MVRRGYYKAVQQTLDVDKGGKKNELQHKNSNKEMAVQINPSYAMASSHRKCTSDFFSILQMNGQQFDKKMNAIFKCHFFFR